MDQPVNQYYQTEWVAKNVDAGLHRELVGGMWNAIGMLQFEFLLGQGLKPHHRLLDVGCGSLRGGVHFIRYLDAGNYFGIDLSAELLDAGYERELGATLQQKLPRSHLIATGDFDFSGIPDDIDYALAQSLFTHLPLNHIRLCLARLAGKMRSGTTFFATFFERPEQHPHHEPLTHYPAGAITFSTQDPYHYTVAELAAMTMGLPWTARYIGEWGHPRSQHMLAFDRH